MKRIITFMMAALMVLNVTAIANEGSVEGAEPVLISEDTIWTHEQDGDHFTIIVEENASTGYTWQFTNNDPDLVEALGDEIIPPEVMMPGAPSIRRFNFMMIDEGVGTITFTYKRSFEDGAAENFEVLAYKRGDKMYIEENGEVYALDGGTIDTFQVGAKVTYNQEEIESDVDVQMVDGIVMVPLRSTLEAMGYEVRWNSETRSIEIVKGAQWTSVTVGENAYFRNKMAAAPLSAAPTIIEDRTLVPVEFFVEIIGKSIQVDSGSIIFTDMEPVVHTGYVHEITYDETGTMSITLSQVEGSEDPMDWTIIHTNSAYTIKQVMPAQGAYIHVAASMVTTMSIPAQTSGYLIW